MSNDEIRYENILKTLNKLDNVLLKAHSNKRTYSHGQIEVLAMLKETFSSRLSSISH